MVKVKKQKITVIVNGRFHAFDYAVALYKKGHLVRLISSMPYSVAKRYGIPRKAYVGLPLFEVLKRSWRKIFKKEFSPVIYSRLFTAATLRFIPRDSNVIIGYAGFCKEVLEAKQFQNALKIIDRGSTHTLANVKLNSQAAKYHNIDWTSNSEEFIDRELAEYGLADKILVPSTFVKSTFTDNGVPPQKMIKIPYAFSLSKFNNAAIEPESTGKIVLFVGQLSARKGIKVLIEAMELVREKESEACLWLVGSKNNIDSALWNKKWVTNFGVLRGEELQDKFLKASLFCLPSFEEGLALVLTEAQYCGLPIVATSNTGFEDIMKQDGSHKGYLVEAGNPQQMANKILDVLQDGDIVKKSGASLQGELMTWDKYADALLKEIGHGK